MPLCKDRSIDFAFTTTTGRDESIPFKFDPDSSDATPFKALPIAKTVLITFPLTGKGPSKKLIDFYHQTHSSAEDVQFIQLGSSGIWQIVNQDLWVTRKSKYNTSNPRAIAEDELLSLGGCVLNLSGLWGGQRNPKSWAGRVAKDKAGVAGKTSLHVVHGLDVARGILAIAEKFTPGERWMVTDLVVYDWWELMVGWAATGSEAGPSDKESGPSEQAVWVRELMAENGVRALPRSMEALGRCYDAREFWDHCGLTPLRSRIV